jgi:hypothetical protein
MSKGESKGSEWRGNVYQPTKIEKSYTPISQGGKVTPPQGGTGTTAKPSSGSGGSAESGGSGSAGSSA